MGKRIKQNANANANTKTNTQDPKLVPLQEKHQHVATPDINLHRIIERDLKNELFRIYNDLEGGEEGGLEGQYVQVPNTWMSDLSSILSTYTDKAGTNKAVSTFVKHVSTTLSIVNYISQHRVQQSDFKKGFRVKTAKYKSIYVTTLFRESFEIAYNTVLLIPTHMKSHHFNYSAAMLVTYLKRAFERDGELIFDKLPVKPVTPQEWLGGTRVKLVEQLYLSMKNDVLGTCPHPPLPIRSPQSTTPTSTATTPSTQTTTV